MVRSLWITGLLILVFSSLNYSAGLAYTSHYNPAYLISPQNDSTDSSDEFKEFNDDEFKEFSEDDEFKSTDEFEESDEFDEFSEFDKKENVDNGVIPDENAFSNKDEMLNKAFFWVLAYLLFTMIAGVLVRFNITRNLRGFFLLAGLAVIGFYKSGCPCMLSSFQETILAITGVDTDWRKLVWFLGLIPVTYIFGRVWCGWICHLGALQEFLFLPKRFRIFRGELSQKVMKILRICLLVALVVQLIVNPVLYFCKIDPFKAVFNLQLTYNHEVTTGILLLLLLLTSVFSYRPFCRAACPVGLILGWVAKIPGASVIGVKDDCIGCKQCNNACEIDAIVRKEKNSVLDNKECIACGECLDSCNRKALGFFRRSVRHKDKVICKNKIE